MGSVRGVGVDIVRIERMRIACSRRTQRFLRRIFTPQEIGYCYGQKEPYSHLSARFAAKEATLKALGVGLGRGAKWTDIEVYRDERGAPKLNIVGPLRERMEERGARDSMTSLSHTGDYAVAVVVLTG
ncbi:MAG TPA: holo-ACP synthase [Thermoproteota archaeon]|nr:holo-ACP synthase [Thermoproteota archaeon]